MAVKAWGVVHIRFRVSLASTLPPPHAHKPHQFFICEEMSANALAYW